MGAGFASGLGAGGGTVGAGGVTGLATTGNICLAGGVVSFLFTSKIDVCCGFLFGKGGREKFLAGNSAFGLTASGAGAATAS